MSERIDTGTLLINAPVQAIYNAFLHTSAVETWLPPAGMSCRVLEYDLREDGRYRIELTYETAEPTGGSGKSTTSTDVTTGRFVEVVMNERIAQTVEFDSDDASFAGEMLMTWVFEPTKDGTRVTVTAEHVPAGISEADHAAGIRSSLENLARFVEPG